MLSECLQSRRLQWPTLCHLIVDRDTMGKVMDCGLHVIVGVPGSCKRVGKFVMQPWNFILDFDESGWFNGNKEFVVTILSHFS